MEMENTTRVFHKCQVEDEPLIEKVCNQWYLLRHSPPLTRIVYCPWCGVKL